MISRVFLFCGVVVVVVVVFAFLLLNVRMNLKKNDFWTMVSCESMVYIPGT